MQIVAFFEAVQRLKSELGIGDNKDKPDSVKADGETESTAGTQKDPDSSPQ